MLEPLISPSARIGPGTEIGYGVVIGDEAVIGSDCRIGHHVVIHPGSRIGNGVRLDDGAVVGKQPLKSPRSVMTTSKQLPPAEIGDFAQIGTGAILYAGCVIQAYVLIADLATVREDVVIGEYTIVGRGVAIENGCSVGRRCKIETNAYVTAKTRVEDDVFIAPGVLTSNDNYLGRTDERFKHFGGPVLRRGCRLGVGAIVLPGREVAEETVVAAGSVLTVNTEPAMVYLGAPARKLRPVPAEQLLNNS